MRKGRYKHETPLDLTAPLPASALVVPPPQPEFGLNGRDHKFRKDCTCSECANVAQYMADYLKSKQIFDRNGF